MKTIIKIAAALICAKFALVLLSEQVSQAQTDQPPPILGDPVSITLKHVYLPIVHMQQSYNITDVKACIADASLTTGVCHFVDKLRDAVVVSGLPATTTVKPLSRMRGAWEGFYIRSSANGKTCDVIYQISELTDDYSRWSTVCEGPLRGDGGFETINKDDEALQSAIFYLGGTIIPYEIRVQGSLSGFWIADWSGRASQGICPLDNPFTEADESQCNPAPREHRGYNHNWVIHDDGTYEATE